MQLYSLFPPDIQKAVTLPHEGGKECSAIVVLYSGNKALLTELTCSFMCRYSSLAN